MRIAAIANQHDVEAGAREGDRLGAADDPTADDRRDSHASLPSGIMRNSIRSDVNAS